MEMCYDGALVMPNSFALITEDEMEYIEGGLTKWQKALAVSVAAVAGIALVTALATGCLALGFASIRTVLKYGAMQVLASHIGAKAAVTAVVSIMGGAGALAGIIINKFF